MSLRKLLKLKFQFSLYSCCLVILVAVWPAKEAIGQTWNSQEDSLARVIEQQYGLPNGLCRAFALQESGYDSAATREEGTYFNKGSRYFKSIAIESEEFLSLHKQYDISLALERAQRSISWGLFQCMGQNLRRLGYERENINPTLEEQFYYFGTFIAPQWKKSHNIRALAAWYNTGNAKRIGRKYDGNIWKSLRKFKRP